MLKRFKTVQRTLLRFGMTSFVLCSAAFLSVGTACDDESSSSSGSGANGGYGYNPGGGSNNGAGSGGGGSSAECYNHADCSGYSLCLGGFCDGMYGRPYTFKFSNVKIATYNEGDSWDTFGGAPDPFLTVEVDDKQVCKTKTKQDTFDPYFSDVCTVTIYQTSKVAILAWDEDLSVHDSIGGQWFDPPFCPDCIRLGEASIGYAGLKNVDIQISVK